MDNKKENKMEDLKQKALYIRITSTEKDLWNKESKKVSRSLCNFIRYVVNQYLQRKEVK